jgi:ABC-type phosphate transport system permease subunit
VLLATAAAGAFLMVNGLHVLFASQFANDAAEPASNVATKFSLVIFVLLFAVGGLGQWNAQRFRQRILR